MSLTIPQTFRTPIAQSIEAKDDGNCAERHPIYSTPSELEHVPVEQAAHSALQRMRSMFPNRKVSVSVDLFVGYKHYINIWLWLGSEIVGSSNGDWEEAFREASRYEEIRFSGFDSIGKEASNA